MFSRKLADIGEIDCAVQKPHEDQKTCLTVTVFSTHECRVAGGENRKDRGSFQRLQPYVPEKILLGNLCGKKMIEAAVKMFIMRKDGGDPSGDLF